MSERRPKTTWEAAAYDKQKQEWVHTELHSYDESESAPLWQATKAHITPTRRKAPKRDHKSIFVFGDAQMGYRRVLDYDTKEEVMIPLHDERAMKLARFICKDIAPDVIVNLGDTYDAAEFSRFKPDSTHFHNVTAPTMQRIHDYYAELRSDNPNARIVEVDSNHNIRLDKAVLDRIPQLANFTRPGENRPMMTYEYMANLSSLDVEFIAGYGAAEFEYADDLAFIHGTRATSNGSTAAQLSKDNPDRNIVQGHRHNTERHYYTDRMGRQLGAFVVGALCRTDGVVPSFYNGVDHQNMPVKRQERWTQSVMHILDYGEGNYQFDDIMLRNGEAYYSGKHYEA